MSDHWIIVVPEEATFVPSTEARCKAVELFRSIAPQADDVKEQATKEVRFIDCGANLERILCPTCDVEIDIEWWQDAMSEEADAGFPLGRLQLPCCGVSRSLAELRYDWPQAFARFSVEAMNPQIGDLTDEQMLAFESVLGCRVRKVLQHV
jgi:hypothetical protein